MTYYTRPSHPKPPTQRLRVRSVASTLLSALLVSPCWALDLKEIYAIAVHNDASIKASRAQADANKERLPQAQSQLLPNATLSAARNHNDLTTRTQSWGQPVSYENRYYGGNQSLSIRQPIYRPYQFAALDQAKAAVQDADASLERDEQTLLVRTSEVYFEALLARDQVQLIAAQKTSYAAQLDAAAKNFSAGAGTRTDIDEAQAKVDLVKAQELEALQNLDWTRRRIEVLTGQPLQNLAPLNTARFSPTAPPATDVMEWISQAEASSPELRALQAQVDQAKLEIDKAQAGHKPTLDAVLQWSRSSSDSVTSINTRYKQQAIGLQLNMPLYSGGYVSSTVRQAVAGHEQARQKLEAARLDLGVRVHQEFRAVTEGVLKISALEQAVRSAQQALNSNRKSFQAGNRTTLDVLNAEQQRTGALRDLAQARYIFLLSRLRLQSLSGLDRWVNIEQANTVLGD